MAPLATELAWIESQVGGVQSVVECSWPMGPHRVWRVEAEQGRCVLKRFGERSKFALERQAYQRWVPNLGSCAPRWIADSVALDLALLTDLEPIAPTLSLEGQHEQAGALLRRFHEIPHRDDDPVDMATALALRLESWLQQAADVISHEDLNWARERFGDPRDFGESPRVPCHRDYTERNWLILNGDRLAVIDFEHARPDQWRADLLKLWGGAWRSDPRLQAAFLRGYGRALTDEDEHLLGRLSVLSAIGTWVWAERHEDARFLEQGKAQWTRLREGSDR